MGWKPEFKFEREKVVIIFVVSLFASCFVASQLFIPQILISIVQHDHPTKTLTEVQAKASIYKSYLDMTIAIVNLIAMPLLGSWSDVVGRKVVIAITSYAQIITVLCLYFAYNMKWLWMIYAMCPFAFILAIQLLAIAYMGDLAKDEKEKTRNYGVAMAAFMFGIILGSIILGVIGGNGRVNSALYTIMAISVIMALFSTFFFKENTPFYNSRHERKFSFANPFKAVRMMIGGNAYVTCMVLVYAVTFVGLSDTLSTHILYAQTRFEWGSVENGVSAALKGLMGVFWQGFGLGILMKRFSRQTILTWALILSFIFYGFMGISSTGWMFLLSGILGGFTSIAIPMIQAIISEHIPKEQQGMALGGMSSISSIATFAGSFVGGHVLAWCIEKEGFTCPGTVFYISGSSYLIAGLACLILFRKFPETSSIKMAGGIPNEEGDELLITHDDESWSTHDEAVEVHGDEDL